MQRPPPFSRLICIVLAVIFAADTFLTPAAEANFWTERRQINTGSTSASPTAAMPLRTELLSQSSVSESMLGADRAGTRLGKILASVPNAYAVVQEVAEGDPNTPPLVILQDVHLNAEAQSNLARTLARLNERIDVVGVEGAFAPFDFTRLRAFPSAVIQPLADLFLREGLLGAASYAGLTSPTGPRYVGVDDLEHYRNNVQAFLASQRDTKTAEHQIASLRAATNPKKPVLFSAALTRFDQLRSGYRQGSVSIGAYINGLMALGAPQTRGVRRFQEAFVLERSLNFAQCDVERNHIFQRLSATLSSAQLGELIKLSNDYRVGAVSSSAFYGTVRRLCEENRVSFSSTPQFEAYLRYVALADSINAPALLRDVTQAELALSRRLAVSAPQQALLAISDQLDGYEKLLHFSLTPQEWETLRKHEVSLTRIAAELRALDITVAETSFVSLATFQHFYEEAHVRSDRMLTALLNEKAIQGRVLVVGGFHTPDFAAVLRTKKIPFAVIAPKITKIQENGETSYLSVFTQEKAFLSRLFSGENLFVKPFHNEISFKPMADAVAGGLALMLAVGGASLPPTTHVQMENGNARVSETSEAVVTISASENSYPLPDGRRYEMRRVQHGWDIFGNLFSIFEYAPEKMYLARIYYVFVGLWEEAVFRWLPFAFALSQNSPYVWVAAGAWMTIGFPLMHWAVELLYDTVVKEPKPYFGSTLKELFFYSASYDSVASSTFSVRAIFRTAFAGGLFLTGLFVGVFWLSGSTLLAFAVAAVAHAIADFRFNLSRFNEQFSVLLSDMQAIAPPLINLNLEHTAKIEMKFKPNKDEIKQLTSLLYTMPTVAPLNIALAHDGWGSYITDAPSGHGGRAPHLLYSVARWGVAAALLAFVAYGNGLSENTQLGLLSVAASLIGIGFLPKTVYRKISWKKIAVRVLVPAIETIVFIALPSQQVLSQLLPGFNTGTGLIPFLGLLWSIPVLISVPLLWRAYFHEEILLKWLGWKVELSRRVFGQADDQFWKEKGASLINVFFSRAAFVIAANVTYILGVYWLGAWHVALIAPFLVLLATRRMDSWRFDTLGHYHAPGNYFAFNGDFEPSSKNLTEEFPPALHAAPGLHVFSKTPYSQPKAESVSTTRAEFVTMIAMLNIGDQIRLATPSALMNGEFQWAHIDSHHGWIALKVSGELHVLDLKNVLEVALAGMPAARVPSDLFANDNTLLSSAGELYADGVSDVAINPTNGTVAIAHKNGLVTRTTAGKTDSSQIGGGAKHVVWSGDGQQILTLANSGRLYAPTFSGELSLRSLNFSLEKFIVDKTGNYVLRVGAPLNILNLTTNEAVYLDTAMHVDAAAVTPDGKYFIVSSKKILHKYDARSGELVWTSEFRPTLSSAPNNVHVTHLVVSPDGKRIAIVDSKGTLYISNDAGEVSTPYADDCHSNVVLFSPDGRAIFFGKESGEIERFEIETKARQKFRAHQTGVVSLDLSPDGATLYSVSKHGALRQWSVTPLPSRASSADLQSLPMDELAALATESAPSEAVLKALSERMWSQSQNNQFPLKILAGATFTPADTIFLNMLAQIPRGPSSKFLEKYASFPESLWGTPQGTQLVRMHQQTFGAFSVILMVLNALKAFRGETPARLLKYFERVLTDAARQLTDHNYIVFESISNCLVYFPRNAALSVARALGQSIIMSDTDRITLLGEFLNYPAIMLNEDNAFGAVMFSDTLQSILPLLFTPDLEPALKDLVTTLVNNGLQGNLSALYALSRLSQMQESLPQAMTSHIGAARLLFAQDFTDGTLGISRWAPRASLLLAGIMDVHYQDHPAINYADIRNRLLVDALTRSDEMVEQIKNELSLMTFDLVSLTDLLRNLLDSDPRLRDPQARRRVYEILALRRDATTRQFLVKNFSTERDFGVRKTMAEGLENQFNDAESLLRAVYPMKHNVIDGINKVAITPLSSLSAIGFANSIFVEEDGLDTLLSSVRALLTIMSHQKPWARLDEIPIATVVIHQPIRTKMLNRYRLSYPLAQAAAPYAGPARNLVAIFKAGQEDPAQKKALNRVSAECEALVDANFAALELIDAHPTDLDKRTAIQIYNQVVKMAEHYVAMGASDGASVVTQLEAIRSVLDSQWARLHDQDVLPEAMRKMVSEPKAITNVANVDTLHTMIAYLHQAAHELELGMASRANGDTELSVGRAEVALINLGEESLLRRGEVRSRALRVLLEALETTHDSPSATVIVKGDTLKMHTKLGYHRAELQLNLAPLDEDGHFLIRFQEPLSTAMGSELRLLFLKTIMEGLGMQVEITNNRYLKAKIDKDRGGTDMASIERAFRLTTRALYYTLDLDLHLAATYSLLKAQLPNDQQARLRARQIAMDMGRIFLSEGYVPDFLRPTSSGHQNLASSAYVGPAENMHEQRPLDNIGTLGRVGQQYVAELASMREQIDHALAGLGLPNSWATTHNTREFGQEAIDRVFNDGIAQAAMFGQLRISPDGVPQRIVDYSPASTLLSAVQKDEMGALRMGAVLDELDPSYVRFDHQGAIGVLPLSRYLIPLARDEILAVHQVVEPRSGRPVYAVVRLVDSTGQAREVSADEVYSLLVRNGVIADAPIQQVTEPQAEYARSLLRSEPRRHEELPGSVLPGMAASVGDGKPILGQVTFDRKTASEQSGGLKKIYIRETTSPDDLPAIKNAGAVVTFSGGRLSHAGITTREYGIPAVILSNASWSRVDGKQVLQITAVSVGDAAQDANGYWISERGQTNSVTLNEGDILIVDGRRGVVAGLFSPDSLGQPFLANAQAALSDTTKEGQSFQRWMKNNPVVLRSRSNLKTIVFLITHLPGLTPVQRQARLRALSSTSKAANNGDETEMQEAVREAFTAASETLLRAFSEAMPVIRSARTSAHLDAILTRLSSQLATALQVAATLSDDASLSRPLTIRFDEIRAAATERTEALKENALIQVKEQAERAHAHEVDLRAIRRALRVAKRNGITAAESTSLPFLQELESALAKKMRDAIEAAPQEFYPFGQIDIDHAHVVGPKAAKLGAMLSVVRRFGGNVPRGGALSKFAFRRFLKDNGIEKRYYALTAELDAVFAKLRDKELTSAAAMEQISDLSSLIRNLIAQAPLTRDTAQGQFILQLIKDAGLENALLAVRSSAVLEDTEGAAFAGAAATKLNVSNEQLLESIKDVWMSFFLPRGVIYRAEQEKSQRDTDPAIILQEMVEATKAGVAFTIDPATGADEVVINAAWGLGENVVSGERADQFTARRVDGLQTRFPVRVKKRTQLVRAADGSGTEVVPLDKSQRRALSMSAAEVEKTTHIAVALADEFSGDSDVEFAFDKDGFNALQERPETTSLGKAVVAAVLLLLFFAPGAQASEIVTRSAQTSLVGWWPSPLLGILGGVVAVIGVVLLIGVLRKALRGKLTPRHWAKMILGGILLMYGVGGIIVDAQRPSVWESQALSGVRSYSKLKHQLDVLESASNSIEKQEKLHALIESARTLPFSDRLELWGEIGSAFHDNGTSQDVNMVWDAVEREILTVQSDVERDSLTEKYVVALRADTKSSRDRAISFLHTLPPTFIKGQLYLRIIQKSANQLSQVEVLTLISRAESVAAVLENETQILLWQNIAQETLLNFPNRSANAFDHIFDILKSKEASSAPQLSELAELQWAAFQKTKNLVFEKGAVRTTLAIPASDPLHKKLRSEIGEKAFEAFQKENQPKKSEPVSTPNSSKNDGSGNISKSKMLPYDRDMGSFDAPLAQNDKSDQSFTETTRQTRTNTYSQSGRLVESRTQSQDAPQSDEILKKTADRRIKFVNELFFNSTLSDVDRLATLNDWLKPENSDISPSVSELAQLMLPFESDAVRLRASAELLAAKNGIRAVVSDATYSVPESVANRLWLSVRSLNNVTEPTRKNLIELEKVLLQLGGARPSAESLQNVARTEYHQVMKQRLENISRRLRAIDGLVDAGESAEKLIGYAGGWPAYDANAPLLQKRILERLKDKPSLTVDLLNMNTLRRFLALTPLSPEAKAIQQRIVAESADAQLCKYARAAIVGNENAGRPARAVTIFEKQAAVHPFKDRMEFNANARRALRTGDYLRITLKGSNDFSFAQVTAIVARSNENRPLLESPVDQIKMDVVTVGKSRTLEISGKTFFERLQGPNASSFELRASPKEVHIGIPLKSLRAVLGTSDIQELLFTGMGENYFESVVVSVVGGEQADNVAANQKVRDLIFNGNISNPAGNLKALDDEKYYPPTSEDLALLLVDETRDPQLRSTAGLLLADRSVDDIWPVLRAGNPLRNAMGNAIAPKSPIVSGAKVELRQLLRQLDTVELYKLNEAIKSEHHFETGQKLQHRREIVRDALQVPALGAVSQSTSSLSSKIIYWGLRVSGLALLLQAAVWIHRRMNRRSTPALSVAFLNLNNVVESAYPGYGDLFRPMPLLGGLLLSVIAIQLIGAGVRSIARRRAARAESNAALRNWAKQTLDTLVSRDAVAQLNGGMSVETDLLESAFGSRRVRNTNAMASQIASLLRDEAQRQGMDLERLSRSDVDRVAFGVARRLNPEWSFTAPTTDTFIHVLRPNETSAMWLSEVREILLSAPGHPLAVTGNAAAIAALKQALSANESKVIRFVVVESAFRGNQTDGDVLFPALRAAEVVGTLLIRHSGDLALSEATARYVARGFTVARYDDIINGILSVMGPASDVQRMDDFIATFRQALLSA